MLSTIYWIDAGLKGRLAIMARPRAGDWLEDEIDQWRASGIDLVVSLLESAESRELGLDDEVKLCRDRQIDFVSFPIPDRQVPFSVSDTRFLIGRLESAVVAGKSVAIHCRAGIGRSGLIAACVLKASGIEVPQAFDLISKARGVAVPDTAEQRDWTDRF